MRLYRSLHCTLYARCTRQNRNFLDQRRYSVDTGHVLRLCVVGSGPAGFYTSKYLLKALDNVSLDMIEALPAPYGLVRYGVAPDHPEIKSVIHDFEHVVEDDRFTFYGNVRVGNDIHIRQLQSLYNIIVLAYGAEDDRKLGIPGEDKASNVFSARSFVGWYNGHPNFRNLSPNVNTKQAVIVGQGNVALDCARMLMKPVDELAKTDIASHAIEALRLCQIEKVYIVGRRGAAQAAFTIKELRELSKIPGVSCVIDPADLDQSMTDMSKVEIAKDRARKRIIDLMYKIASNFDQASKAPRQIHIKFLCSPVEITHNPGESSRLSIEKTKLYGDSFCQKAAGTNVFEDINCGLLVRSIGYLPQPLDDVPYDFKTSTLSHAEGRIIDQETMSPIPGLYCSGWVKRGASGIIGSNIVDARETVSSISEDVKSSRCPSIQDPDSSSLFSSIRAQNPSKQVVSWKDVEKISREEKQRGEANGKVLEKVTSVKDMLEIVKSDQ
uniref:NADPH:adrenodoxin oxidoreductase, mitochondrial n=1 Tax=Albugo laibachii Nc14 TaxID=890382 RepID=F0W6I6_9STRA|nr:NADPH:adrenodoxin oxidoreductase putative [Albugo laibachii Nc14]CCA21834.1 NADPH:adrenodoxin oxidoreductase putative [Albugo laibachii Nc14]|eukprot:CCA21834.1 NADPH:adrenodoxin oxidoreductase putative [Albugo laibachii Nc14]